jgi:hypothetical protein
MNAESFEDITTYSLWLLNLLAQKLKEKDISYTTWTHGSGTALKLKYKGKFYVVDCCEEKHAQHQWLPDPCEGEANDKTS